MQAAQRYPFAARAHDLPSRAPIARQRVGSISGPVLEEQGINANPITLLSHKNYRCSHYNSEN